MLGCLLSVPAHAQTSQGTITGKVSDPKGAVLPGAAVRVTNKATQLTLDAVTNREGIYIVQSLNPGEYTLEVASPGFEKARVDTVTVNAAQTTAVDVSMSLGKATETITVTAQNSLLSPETSDVTTTVDHAIVENLPYPERSSIEAALLVPGVTGDPSVPGGIFSENPVITTGPVVPGASLRVGGTPPGTTTILVDGSDDTQASYARLGVSLSGHLVEQTTVITSGLSAQYGRTSAGAIVQASKAGTSVFHGAVTWRHTDPFFNAYPLGSTAPNDEHENFFGAYVGGPVRIPRLYNGRDKTFFFVGVEPARLDNTLGFRGQFDTPADLAGQFYNSISLLNQTILKSQGYAAALAAPRVGGIYYNTTHNAQGFPNGTLGSAPSTPVMGPTGLYDASNVLANNPFAQYVVSQLPTPSNPGPYITFDNPQGTYDLSANNASYKRGVTNRDNRYSFRIDHKFNDANQIWGRYTVVPLSGPRFFALATDSPLNQVPTDTINSHNIAVGYTRDFSSSVVNVFRYSFLRVNDARTPPATALSQDWAAKYGLTPATLQRGFPNLGTLGSSTLQIAADTPYIDIDQNFIAGDDITWSKGRHLFQFGGDFRWIQSNQYDTSLEYGGKYSFSAQMTNTTGTSAGAGGNALATLIMGDIFSYQAAPVAVPGYYRWRYDAAYFQDNWRVAPNLTLNLGVRYEVELPRREKFNNQALIRLNNPGTLNGTTTTAAFCFSGACGSGAGLWPTNWHGFEPRIGIDYSPTSRSTVRASYGMMRPPLTGYENTPDPNFNVASNTIGNFIGGSNSVAPATIVNYMTNPVPAPTSAYTALNGARGPIYTSSGFSPVYVNQTNAVPYLQTWNLTLQYQVTPHTVIETKYSGVKGTHLIGYFVAAGGTGTHSLNVPPLATLISAVQSGAYLNATSANQYGLVTNETGLQKLNPYQNFYAVSIPEIYPRNGTSEYHAFDASVTQRVSGGLSLLAFYTWSKSMDNVPDTNAGNSGNFSSAPPQDPTNPSAEWAVSSYDQPSLFKVGYNYQLPFGAAQRFDTRNRLLNELIGNFTTAGIFTMASGYPNVVTLGSTGYFTSFTPKGSTGGSASTCTTTSFCASSALPTGYLLRPNIVPGVPLINPGWKRNPFGLNGGAFTPYLNAAAFTTPGSLNNPALGNAPRTLTGARSPRETMFDMRVVKGFNIGERYQFKLIAQANNVFNHPVYFAANNTANDPLQSAVTNVTSGTRPSITFNQASTTFGHLNINSANLSRVLRVGAEFVF
ncbi:MAG TPA: carboxypeptidase regulatory-like domain-containing protein [Bryobacteraceae bacterium]